MPSASSVLNPRRSADSWLLTPSILVLALSSLLPLFCAGQTTDQGGERWWPVQTVPQYLVRTTNQQQFPEPRVALQMMV